MGRLWVRSLALNLCGLGAGSLLLSIAQAEPVAENRRLQMAEAFAPILFQHERPFNRNFDSIVDFFFDGDRNLRNNGKTISQLSEEQELKIQEEPVLYFSVIESRSHFYLNYVVYHAYDSKDWDHAHDTENILVVVDKLSLKQVAVISNAHGFPMIYSDDLILQDRWRSKINRSARRIREFLEAIDLDSGKMHRLGDLESVVPESDQVGQHSLFFIASGTHAIYKLNSSILLMQQLPGSLYFPRSCLGCTPKVAEISKSSRQISVRSYQLVDLDLLILSGELGLVDKGEPKLSSPIYRLRKMPGYLPPGDGELEPSANLFYEAHFKTPFPLADPAQVHLFLDSEEGRDTSKISASYVENIFVERKWPAVLTSQRQSPVRNKAKSSPIFLTGGLMDFANRFFRDN